MQPKSRALQRPKKRSMKQMQEFAALVSLLQAEQSRGDKYRVKYS